MDDNLEICLEFLKAKIPVTIDRLTDITTDSAFISFDEYKSSDKMIKNAIDESGCFIVTYDKVIDVTLSSRFFDGALDPDTRAKVNSQILSTLRMMFNSIEKIDELVVSISGCGSLIIPITDYVTDRYEDIGKLTIHVYDPGDENEVFGCVRNFIQSSSLLYTKEQSLYVYDRVYGKYPH